MPRLGWTWVAALLLLAPSTALAQAPVVTATVDRATVDIHDEIELSVSLEGVFDSFDPPDLTAFSVVQEGVTRVISGRQSSTVRTYTLRPRRAGQATIGAARAWRGGQVVAESRPITVTVQEPAPLVPISAQENLDLSRYANEGLFVRMVAPRGRYYVGEPFALTMEIYSRVGTQVTGVETVGEPRLDGLLVEDLPGSVDPSRGQRVRVGDTAMASYDIGRWLATPLRAGRVVVDSTTLRISLASGLMSRHYTRATQPFWVDVVPIPREGRPPIYDEGNVGRFEVTASLTDDRGRTPETARTGQRMVLRVEIEGRGNLLTLKAPRVEEVPAFDVQPLPSAADDVIIKDQGGMRGKRTFQYLLSAREPGRHTTPAVRFAFFDTEAERFEVRELPGASLEVTGLRVSGETSAALLSGEDVRPLVEEATLRSGGRTPLARSPIYWTALAMPLLGLLFVETRYRLRRRDEQNPGQRLARVAHSNARKRLRAAEQALRDGLVKDFYAQVSRTLIGYLEERTNLPATGMTHDELRRAARAAGYGPDTVDAVIVELENCDFARFAPQGSAATRMRESLDRATELLRELDRVQPERRP